MLDVSPPSPSGNQLTTESYDLCAWETATGDPVILVYGEEKYYVLRPDGTMELSE